MPGESHGQRSLVGYSPWGRYIVTGFAIRIPDGKKIGDAIQYFKKVEGVKSVERDRIYHIDDPIGPRRRLDKMPLIKPE